MFQVGDWVRVAHRNPYWTAKPEAKGVVLENIGSVNDLALVWSEDDGNRILVPFNCLKPVSGADAKIVISYDGAKYTTALLMENGFATRIGVAKRHPQDTHDFVTGAKIALERMMEGK